MNFIILTGAAGVFFQRTLGAYQLANHLRNNGYTCQVIDFTYSFTSDELISTVESFITEDTLAIGVSTTFYNEQSGEDAAVKVRAFTPGLHTNIKTTLEHIKLNYPNVKRIAGGGYSSLFNNDPLFNVIVDGYAEDEMLQLANTWSGKTTQDQFNIETLEHRFSTQDCILPNETLPIEISRGCIFRCSFCAYPLNGKKKLDYIRSAKCVADEMRYNYEQYGTTNYIFTDDTFNDSTEKLKRLHAEITKLPFKINFYAYARIDLLNAHPEQIALMREMGLRTCNFGIETFHPTAAKAIGKNMPAEKVKQFLLDLKNTHWPDINVVCSMIIGLPGEPADHIKQSMKWFDDAKLCAVFFSLTFQSYYTWKSEFVLNPDKYGYSFDENGKWYTDQMTERQATIMHLRFLHALTSSDKKIDAFATMQAMTHYDHDTAMSLTWNDLQIRRDEIASRKAELCNQYKDALKIVQNSLH